MYFIICALAVYSLFIPTEMFPIWLDAKFKTHLHLDKLLHATLFFVIVVTTHWASTVRRRYLMATAIAMGAATEIVQYFISGRSASVGDFLADASGALTAGWLIGVFSVFTATKIRDLNVHSNHSADVLPKNPTIN